MNNIPNPTDDWKTGDKFWYVMKDGEVCKGIVEQIGGSHHIARNALVPGKFSIRGDCLFPLDSEPFEVAKKYRSYLSETSTLKGLLKFAAMHDLKNDNLAKEAYLDSCKAVVGIDLVTGK